MQIVEGQGSDPSATRGAFGRAHIFIDCIDDSVRDLLTLWLAQAGYAASDWQAAGSSATFEREASAGVLITDRFGPGRDRGITVPELRARYPKLQIVVVGSGGGDQAAQLSLARVVGAHATLPMPIARQQVLALLDHAR